MTAATAVKTKTADGTRFRCIECAPFVTVVGSDTGRELQGIVKRRKERHDWLKGWPPVRARLELTDRRSQSIGPKRENGSVMCRSRVCSFVNRVKRERAKAALYSWSSAFLVFLE